MSPCPPFVTPQLCPQRRRAALFGAALWVFAAQAAPLRAQIGIGGAPDGGPIIPTKESFEQNLKDAPWSAGAWRFQPWLGLRDASLVTNQVTATDPSTQRDERDFTLSAGAGLRAYYPKNKLLFTAHVLPEYVWWQDSEEKRHLGGRYGGALFGFYNRFRFELSARAAEQQGFFSREVQQLTTTRELEERVVVELRVASGISAYGYANLQSLDGNDEDFAFFTALDREKTAVGAGMRLSSPRGWKAHVAFEQNSTEFADGARDLSSDGALVEVTLGFERPRIGALLDLRFEELEPTATSFLEPYSDLSGSFQLLYQPRESFALAFFASRAFDYSIDSDFSHFTSELQGLRMQLSSKRGGLGVFAAIGEDEYEAIGENPNRFDDVTEMGARLDIRMRRLFIIAVNVLRRDYDSSDDVFDRDVTSFGLSIQLGELAERLRLGSDEAAW